MARTSLVPQASGGEKKKKTHDQLGFFSVVVVFKILEALVTFRYLKQNKTPNYSVQRPQAMQRTEHILYKHLTPSPGGDSCPEGLPKPQTGPCVQGRESGQGSHVLCHPRGCGLPVVAGKSQENRPPCSLWMVLTIPAPVILTTAWGHPGSQTKGS